MNYDRVEGLRKQLDTVNVQTIYKEVLKYNATVTKMELYDPDVTFFSLCMPGSKHVSNLSLSIPQRQPSWYKIIFRGKR